MRWTLSPKLPCLVRFAPGPTGVDTERRIDTIPVLVVHADDDQIVPYAYARPTLVPHAAVAPIEIDATEWPGHN